MLSYAHTCGDPGVGRMDLVKNIILCSFHYKNHKIDFHPCFQLNRNNKAAELKFPIYNLGN